MQNKELTERQKIQEEQYIFPYHYIDLHSAMFKLVLFIEYNGKLKVIRSLLEPFAGQRILDAGCGDGRLCYELKKEKCRIVGVDYSEKAIRFAKAFSPELDFYVQDLKKLDLPYRFDQIVAQDVLEHIPPTEIPLVLENLHKSLKKDGVLLVMVPSKNKKLEEKHYQHFDENALRRTLKDCFYVKDTMGSSKRGLKAFIFETLKLSGLAIFPFKHFLGKGYYNLLKNYYYEELLRCDPKEGESLIAVCKRKPEESRGN